MGIACRSTAGSGRSTCTATSPPKPAPVSGNVADADATVLPPRAGRSAGLESLQDDVKPALAALELVPIHYESTDPTTHAAAEDQLEVADETIAGLEDDLRALD